MDEGLKGQVRDLLAECAGMDYGATRVAAAEAAARLADAHGDVGLGFEAREAVIDAAIFSGLDARAIAPFSWCLAQCDRDPVRHTDNQMLWQYKWITGHVMNLAQIPRADLLAMIDDMDRRYRRNHLSPRPVHKARLELAIFSGDERAARVHHAAWESSRRDAFADCAACDRDSDVEYLAFLGEDGPAVDAAAPILAGRMRCKEVPRVTLATLLLPLVRLGRLDEAMACHRKGHRLVARQRLLAKDAARHMVFLALTGHLTKGLRLLESHLPFPRDPAAIDHVDRFEFALAARFLLGRLRRSGKGSVRLRLAPDFPAHRDDGAYDVDALADWFDRDALRLATAFDARNGTDGFARRVAASRTLDSLASPFPMKGSA